jgi:hypothetical protein
VHHFNINGQTPAGKRLQNEQRKRRSEILQRAQVDKDVFKSDPPEAGAGSMDKTGEGKQLPPDNKK